MQPKYEVPVIPHNLRREETIVQIAESLQYLSDVSTDIFKRIDARIAHNKTQVNNISQRIATASNKLNKLAGAKKATQVFSSCKYPGENINKPYKTIFDNKEVLPVKKFDYVYKTTQVIEEPPEALQFYYVKVKGKSNKPKMEGLGEPSSDLETINDMLLFNTGRNAYSKGETYDKLNNSALNAGKRGKDESEVDIGAAPYSISQGLGLGVPKTIGEKYFYAPHLGDVPLIDVPLDLPDLPGIADDLRYQTEQEPNIAPSVSIISPQFATVIPDLPEIEDISHDAVEATPAVSKMVQNGPIVTPPPVVETRAAPPTMTSVVAEQNIPSVPERTETIPNNTTQKTLTTAVAKPSASDVKQPQLPSFSGENARASLMEAIRNAGGGKNLKHKSEDTQHSNKQPPPTGDLMADLHAKLSMRRKGISGNKADNPTAMDKISDMIPPPPTTHSDVSESAEEEDWDD